MEVGNSSFFAAHMAIQERFVINVALFVELELAITALTRDGKFRSKLHERTMVIFKGLLPRILPTSADFLTRCRYAVSGGQLAMAALSSSG